MITNIHIIGAGAVGAAYAALLYDLSPECVSFVAVGERYRRLKGKGVIVNGLTYPIPVLNGDDAYPPADLLIVAVKHHHLDQASVEMKNSVGEHTVILSLMNGIDSEDRIGAVYGGEKLLYATVLGIDALRVENRVIYTNQGKIYFGEKGQEVRSPRVEMVRELFDRAGIKYEIPVNIIKIIWWKFMINVGINQSSAVLKDNYGAFQNSSEARNLMEGAMREVIALAQKTGIDLSEADIQKWYTVLAGLSPEGKTSMLQDVEAGRKTEVEMLGGAVIAMGRRYGVATPVNERLYAQITGMEKVKGKEIV